LIGDIANATITADETTFVGGLAGQSSGSIVRCSSSGAVGFGGYAGGLVGNSQGPIDSSDSSASVRGGTAGGLAGETSGAVTSSHASGQIGGSSSLSAGGLVGEAGGSISNSYATGDATAQYGAAGLVETNTGIISNSFATGSAHATSNQDGATTLAGGLIANNGGDVDDVYALGDARAANAAAGGLVGDNVNQGSITAAYSIGVPSVDDSERAMVGGFIGSDLAKIRHGYWNMDTSGIEKSSQGAGNRKNDPGIKGLSDSELKSALPDGFDPGVWGQSQNINNGYPYLLANPPQ
jgi:hypothetical protein